MTRTITSFIVAITFSLVAAAQGQVYKPGNGVSLPSLIKEVKPDYTDEAKAARIEGTVTVKMVVRTDGTVGDVQVTQSLDTKYGLDEQAVKAARQWQFKPGMKDGKAVDVEVTVEMAFTLK